MAKVRRAAKPVTRKKLKPKAPKPFVKALSQSQRARPRFPHLCHICYTITSRISELRPTIPEAYKYGLRFQRILARSKPPPCSFCTLLLESVQANTVKFDFRKPVHFILVAPGPEKDTPETNTPEGLIDMCYLNLYLEGSIKPGHYYRETFPLGNFMVSTRSGKYFAKKLGYFTEIIGIESPTAEFISNRPPILDVASQASYDQTREWLQYCDLHHDCYAASETTFTPTRVIDVGTADDIPRLIQPRDHSCRYAALSYCWGGEQSVMTTRKNVEEFFIQLPTASLQRTIKDAIFTTRNLGLRFL
jgi:hypothetical protein